MNYPWANIGTKIDDYDLPRIGHRIGVGEDEIHALLDVESHGAGFDEHGVTRLFEEHVFYRELPKAKRVTAQQLGLAHPTWRKNYKNNLDRLKRAYEFDSDAALRATSWGLGQIMGFNHKLAGYDTPLEMVEAFALDEAAQLEGMIEFIINAGLNDELRNHEWAVFARGYNGSEYAKNNYHIRLAQRFAWWQTKPDTPWTPEMAVLESKMTQEQPSPVPTLSWSENLQAWILDSKTTTILLKTNMESSNG
jgi:hypothetical protein